MLVRSHINFLALIQLLRYFFQSLGRLLTAKKERRACSFFSSGLFWARIHSSVILARAGESLVSREKFDKIKNLLYNRSDMMIFVNNCFQVGDD
jgi:hypothetical protein